MCEHVYTVDGEVFIGEIHTNISWAKFSRVPIFADGCDHEIFEPNKFLFSKSCTHANGRSSYAEGSLCMWIPCIQDIWEAAVGETVVCMLEAGNFHDKNAVAVKKDGRIIGHLPWKVSRFYMLFF